jgi:hypothetical protein
VCGTFLFRNYNSSKRGGPLLFFVVVGLLHFSWTATIDPVSPKIRPQSQRDEGLKNLLQKQTVTFYHNFDLSFFNKKQNFASKIRFDDGCFHCHRL